MSYDAEVLADAPLSYWKLDETSGVVLDSVGAVDGTVSGAVVQSADGMTLGGDPAPAPALRIDFGDNYRFAGLAPFSIEHWAKTLDLGLSNASAVQIQIEPPGGGNPQPWAISTVWGTHDVFRWDGGGAFDELSAGIDDGVSGRGVWTHWVFTFDGTDMRVARDGSEAPIGGGGPSSAVLPDVAVALRVRSIMQEGSLGTVLRRLAIYGHALSPERIAAHYAAGIAAPSSGLSLRDVPATTIFRPKRLS